jgi:hypothetical protein
MLELVVAITFTFGMTTIYRKRALGWQEESHKSDAGCARGCGRRVRVTSEPNMGEKG